MVRYIPKDHYFEKAKALGFKARSIFKLEEIDKSLKLIKPNYIILDLGCAPGSWLQYVAQRINDKGVALGIDLSPIKEKIHNRIKTVVEDCLTITDEKISNYMKEFIPSFTYFDLILSDMAPKTSGIKHVDQSRSIDLAYKVLKLAEKLLKPGGHVVIKVFGSGEINELVNNMKGLFKIVKQMRPKSVRSASKELFIVGMYKK